MARQTLIKICGLTNISDARLALEAGADLIGLNLVGGPRQIEPETAERILAALPEATGCTVLLVALQAGRVSAGLQELLRTYPGCLLQLYGEVTPEAVSRLLEDGFRSILVHHVQRRETFAEVERFLTDCGDHAPAYVLLDAKVPGRLGGTGTRVDVETIVQAQAAGRFHDWPPILLAGGLTPGNVAELIRRIEPAGVDVSSGVESTPRRKDSAKVRAFIATVRDA